MLLLRTWGVLSLFCPVNSMGGAFGGGPGAGPWTWGQVCGRAPRPGGDPPALRVHGLQDDQKGARHVPPFARDADRRLQAEGQGAAPLWPCLASHRPVRLVMGCSASCLPGSTSPSLGDWVPRPGLSPRVRPWNTCPPSPWLVTASALPPCPGHLSLSLGDPAAPTPLGRETGVERGGTLALCPFPWALWASVSSPVEWRLCSGGSWCPRV